MPVAYAASHAHLSSFSFARTWATRSTKITQTIPVFVREPTSFIFQEGNISEASPAGNDIHVVGDRYFRYTPLFLIRTFLERSSGIPRNGMSSWQARLIWQCADKTVATGTGSDSLEHMLVGVVNNIRIWNGNLPYSTPTACSPTCTRTWHST